MKTIKLNSNRGSMVVEASLVVPVVILCVFAVIYMAMLLYQQAHMQAIADRAAQRGAAVWDNRARWLEIGRVCKEDLDEEGLYWELFDVSKQEKAGRVLEYAKLKLKRSNVIAHSSGGSGRLVAVEMSDFIIYKKLTVTVEDSYNIPINRLMKVFGAGDAYRIKAKSEAIIHQPAEFIRNTDFALDLERELEEKYPELKNTGDRTRSAINGIKEKIGKFFSDN